MTPDELIGKARQVLHLRGWHQGNFSNENGNVCIRGALLVALTGAEITRIHQFKPELTELTEVYSHAVDALVKVMDKEFYTDYIIYYSDENPLTDKELPLCKLSAVAKYNDDHCKSIDDVDKWLADAKAFL